MRRSNTCEDLRCRSRLSIERQLAMDAGPSNAMLNKRSAARGLSAQELLQCRDLMVGAIHVLVRGLKILLTDGAIRLVQKILHPVHGSHNVAAHIQPLGLLLGAHLLHAAGSRLPSRIEVHEPVMGLANLLRRGPRRCGRRIGT